MSAKKSSKVKKPTPEVIQGWTEFQSAWAEESGWLELYRLELRYPCSGEVRITRHQLDALSRIETGARSLAGAARRYRVAMRRQEGL